MRVFGLRMQVVGLTFLVVLGVALAAGQLLYERRVRSPLEEVLLQVDGVEAVTVEPGGSMRAVGPTHIRVRLSPDADLERAYGAVARAAADNLGSRLGRIELEDARSPELEETLREMRFAVEEAVATGSFQQMADTLRAVAAARSLDHFRVSVDRQFVYLTLARDGAYLHELVARTPYTAGGAATPGSRGEVSTHG